MADELKTDSQETADLKGSEVEKVFTQDEVNHIVKKRVGEDSEKITKSILGDIGVESLDSLKEIINAKHEAEEAEKSELQKLQEAMDTREAEKLELDKKYAELQKQSNLNAMAAKHGIKELEYFNLELQKQGEGFNEAEFVEGLRESKPFIFGESVKKVTTDTSGNTPQDPQSLDALIAGIKDIRDLEKLQKTL